MKLSLVIAGEGLSEAAIREGYTRFKAEKNAAEIAAMAQKHGLATAALQGFVDAILKEYGGTVIRKDVPPENIIPRGPHGYGTIALKPGAIPKKSKSIPLSGVQYEVMVEVAEAWFTGKEVEPGYGLWTSPAFVVAKKEWQVAWVS